VPAPKEGIKEREETDGGVSLKSLTFQGRVIRLKRFRKEGKADIMTYNEGFAGKWESQGPLGKRKWTVRYVRNLCAVARRFGEKSPNAFRPGTLPTFGEKKRAATGERKGTQFPPKNWLRPKTTRTSSPDKKGGKKRGSRFPRCPDRT